MMPGAPVPERQADDNIRFLVAQVRADAEGQLGASYPMFEPVTYRSQVVAGTN